MKKPVAQLEALNLAVPSVLTTLGENVDLDYDKGVSFVARGCTHPTGWVSVCNLRDGEPREDKKTHGQWEDVEFGPFQFYSLELADCFDAADLDALTEATVNEARAWAVAQEIDHAPWSRNGHSLQTAATQLNATPVSVVDGLGMLEEALDQRGYGSGMLWGPRRVRPKLVEANQLTLTPGRYRAGGLPFVFGTTGNGPTTDTIAAPNIPEPGTAWLYATTSRAEYRLSPTTPYEADSGGGVSNVQRWWNLNQAGAESLIRGVVRFNPLCVFAVLVDHRSPVC